MPSSQRPIMGATPYQGGTTFRVDTNTKGSRRLTIWYNKEDAAIETSDGSIWGTGTKTRDYY